MHTIASMMIVASVLAQAASDPPQKPVASQAPPAAIVTRQMEFQLPFKTPPINDKEKAPVEVRLFVSSDAGRNWKPHSRVRPGTGHFKFAAPKDGQYSFVIRTVDRRGALWPKAEPKPEMQVTVDTHPPKIELTAVWNTAGHVTAAWQVTDPTLKPASLRLQYRTAAIEPWQAVAIAPPATGQSQKQSGKATWWPKSTTGPLFVRFEAQDNAGNPAVAQRTLKAPLAEQAKAAVSQSPRGKTQHNAVGEPGLSTGAVGSFSALDRARAESRKGGQAGHGTPLQQSVNHPRGAPIPFVQHTAKPVRPRDNFAPRVATQTPLVAKQAVPPRPSARKAIPACRVKLTSTARQHGRLTIRWKTSGASTLNKTIHIAYSNTAKGPWLPVALNQPDDGHHVWKFDRSVPDQVFLMIEVIDRAGARSSYISPGPLWLHPKPSGVPHTGQAPAEYRFF